MCTILIIIINSASLILCDISSLQVIVGIDRESLEPESFGRDLVKVKISHRDKATVCYLNEHLCGVCMTTATNDHCNAIKAYRRPHNTTALVAKTAKYWRLYVDHWYT